MFPTAGRISHADSGRIYLVLPAALRDTLRNDFEIVVHPSQRLLPIVSSDQLTLVGYLGWISPRREWSQLAGPRTGNATDARAGDCSCVYSQIDRLNPPDGTLILTLTRNQARLGG